MAAGKEYGGYIELEYNRGPEYHSGALALNCGRSCLAYLIESRHIETLYLPFFLCASVSDVCRKYGVSLKFYSVNGDFTPIFDGKLGPGEWLYLVNYYGQLPQDLIRQYKSQYENLIVDNAQAFFEKPLPGVDTLYTCRKFFGVPDGAYLYTDGPKLELTRDLSWDRMDFLLGRFEKTASEFYSRYTENNRNFRDAGIRAMSKLTANLLRGIDYAYAARTRQENFACLHEALADRNQLQLSVPAGPFMYPLWVEGGREIRKKLQSEKIYVPTLWPDVFTLCDPEDPEYRMAADILPLPVDQRYGREDMEVILAEVRKLLD